MGSKYIHHLTSKKSSKPIVNLYEIQSVRENLSGTVWVFWLFTIAYCDSATVIVLSKKLLILLQHIYSQFDESH